MRHENTICVENVFNNNANLSKEKTIGCIVFQTFDTSPYGDFISYVALSEKFKTDTLHRMLKF